jgi:hypothetical protein
MKVLEIEKCMTDGENIYLYHLQANKEWGGEHESSWKVKCPEDE